MTMTLFLLTSIVAFQAEDAKVPATPPAINPFTGLPDGVEQEPQPEADNPMIRKWSSHSGESTTTAEFLEFKDSVVVLKTVPDGRTIKVKPSQLSDEDMQWVREEMKLRRDNRPAKYACKRCKDKHVVPCINKNCKRGTVWGKKSYPTVISTPVGPYRSMNVVLEPIGPCKACNGEGLIPCPQCMQDQYDAANAARASVERAREEERAVKRARDMEMAELRRAAEKASLELTRLDLERKKRTLEGVEASGGKTIDEERQDVQLLKDRIEADIRRLEAEKRRVELEERKKK